MEKTRFGLQEGEMAQEILVCVIYRENVICSYDLEDIGDNPIQPFHNLELQNMLHYVPGQKNSQYPDLKL